MVVVVLLLQNRGIIASRSLLAIIVFLAVPPAPASMPVPIILAVILPGPMRPMVPVMPAGVPVAAVPLLPRRPVQRILDFLLLLLNQEVLHWVVVVVVLLQQHELPLLLQHRPVSTPRSRLVLASLAHIRVVVPTAAASSFFLKPLPPLQRLPVDAALVHVLVVPGLVPRMVDADHAAIDGRAAQVVDGEVGAALVLVLEPAEAARLARLLVAGELEEGRLAELREDGDYIALAELVGQPAEVDEGGIAVVDMPGGVGGAIRGLVVLACAGRGARVQCFEVVGGCTHIPCSISFLLSSCIARILFMVAGGEVALLLALVMRKGAAVARLGDFWVTSVRLKPRGGAGTLGQGSPSAEQAGLRFVLIHLHFKKGNDDHLCN